MTRIVAVAVAVLASATSVACFHPQNDLRGQCSSDTDCGPAARCDKTVSPPVCVASTCSPACDSSSVCDTQTVTCKPVTTPSIVVTTPAANAFVGGKVQVTATARAPGAVTGVTFQVKNGAGTVIGTGSATAVPGSADFSANLTLGPTGLSDGPATVSATLTYPGGTLPSEIVPVTIDVTPPVLVLQQVFLADDNIPA
ncbi:MAG: Ig-like domain-containing protein, partial [Myxococcales bacterium]